MMKVLMLTTTDNPYDPFTQFDDWFSFDERKGYHTCGYIERIAKVAPDLSASDQIFAINEAIEEIFKYNVLGTYKIVSKDVEAN